MALTPNKQRSTIINKCNASAKGVSNCLRIGARGRSELATILPHSGSEILAAGAAVMHDARKERFS